MKTKTNKLISAILSVFLLSLYVTPAYAASLTLISDTMSRQKVSENSNHTIEFTTANAWSASGTVVINLEDSFTTTALANSDPLDYDIKWGVSDKTIVAAGACAANSIEITSINNSTREITFTLCSGSTASGSNEVVEIEIGSNATNGGTGNSQIQNSGTTGSKVHTIVMGADSGSFATPMLTDEQVVVSTTVDPYITFTVSDNTIALATAAGGYPSYLATGYNRDANDPLSLAANTNAASGYNITYLGTTLTSQANTIDPIGGTPAASSTGTEQFGMNLKNNATPDVGADPSGGSGSAESDYNSADQYSYETGSYIPLAKAAGPSLTTTFRVSFIANIGQITEAGNYTATITYVCTGNF